MSKDKDYLPFLRNPPLQSGGDIGPEAYGMMSRGLKELYAARDAKRDLMVAMLHEPERRRQQTLMWLMADVPSPSRSRH